MSNRFERLFQLPPNLHSADSPVILLAGALLRDTQSQKVLVQLKFKNISSHKVKAVKVHIAMYDVIGERIGGTKEYQYLDLGVNSGDVFGSNKAIILPNAESKSFAIESLSVVLDDSLVQDITMPLVALPDSESLEEVLKHPELFKQFRLEINEQAIYAPQEIEDTWCCSCGEWNGTEVCINCSVNKEYLFSIYDPSILIEKTKERLRRERHVQENRKESEGLIVKDANVTDQSTIPTNDRHIKKKKGIWIITILLVVLTVGIAAFVLLGSSPEMTSIDRKYAKLTNKAAKELLQAEVSDCTWTTVETGKLVYLYTAKNSKENQLEVHYLVKFDAADEPEDEWLELIISLSGETELVTNTSAVYWNVDSYKASFDENNKFKGFSFSRSAGENWYNINLSDTEIDEIKQKYSDWLSDGESEKELDTSSKAEKIISEESKPSEPQKTLVQLTKEEKILVGSWEGEMVVSDGTFITDEDYASAGSTMTIAKMCNVKITDDRSGLLYFDGEYSSFEWEYNATGDGLIVYSVKMGNGNTILTYTTDPDMKVLYKKLILYIEDDTQIIFTKS